MEYTEFTIKKKKLREDLKALEMLYIYSQTKLRIGDTVKFTTKGDAYNKEPDVKYREKIHDFEVSADGVIYVKTGNHGNPWIGNCRKCNKTT